MVIIMTIVKKLIAFYPEIGEMLSMISYRPFWQTLKARNMTTYTLINVYGISSATIDRMKKGLGITTMKVDDFCTILNCRVEDIIEYIPKDGRHD